MLVHTPAIRYLLARLAADLRGERPDETMLPPRPEVVETWELRAALQHFAETMRSEFADFSSQVKGCDSETRRALDVELDAILTRLEARIDQI
jgi:hypothetical protein